MRSPARALLVTLVMLVTASRGLRAQCSGGFVSQFREFTVTPTALALPDADATTFNAGASVSSYSIFVNPQRNNRTWYLCVSALSLNMGSHGGYTKPLGDLQWSLDGTSWTSVALLGLQPIVSDRGRRTITLYIRSLLSYANDVPNFNGSPATYSANLLFQVAM